MKTFSEIYAAVKPSDGEHIWSSEEKARLEAAVEKFHLSPDALLSRMGLDPYGWTAAEKAAIDAALYPISTPGDADAPETPAGGPASAVGR